MVNYKKLGEEHEQRADKLEYRSRTEYENPPLLKQIFEEYEQAGKNYAKGGAKADAKRAYIKAMKNTYSKNLKSDIKSDIKKLGPVKESSLLKILKQFDEELTKAEGIMGIKKNISFAISSVICLAFALFFVSPSITGYDILNIGENNLQWIGLCSFICGLVFAFLYLKKKGKF